MIYRLCDLDKTLKTLVLAFTLVSSTGSVIGLIYLYQKTSMSPSGTIVNYNGSPASENSDEFDVPAEYPKPAGEMLLTTHNHVISMAFLFFMTGVIFAGSTLITGFWKKLLATEPLISLLVTFGSLWGMRFLHPGFVYLAVLSGIAMYTSYFVMVFLILFELVFKHNKP